MRRCVSVDVFTVIQLFNMSQGADKFMDDSATELVVGLCVLLTDGLRFLPP